VCCRKLLSVDVGTMLQDRLVSTRTRIGFPEDENLHLVRLQYLPKQAELLYILIQSCTELVPFLLLEILCDSAMHSVVALSILEESSMTGLSAPMS